MPFEFIVKTKKRSGKEREVQFLLPEKRKVKQNKEKQ